MPSRRQPLLLYYGVLAPRAAWRGQVVGADPAQAPRPGGNTADIAGTPRDITAQWPDPPARSWAALMRRAFGFDVLACSRCGQAMRLIAMIEQVDVFRRILRHLGEATEVPAPAPARAPPSWGTATDWYDGQDHSADESSC